MRRKTKEQLEALCERATREQDSQTLLALVREINELLMEENAARRRAQTLFPEDRHLFAEPT